jgi:hypothetical protein
VCAETNRARREALPRSSVEPWIAGLRGEALMRQGRAAEAREMLKEVENRVRAAPGPDAWTAALFRLESIARVAREVGDWELAEHTGRQKLEHDAAYRGSHYALALWRNADPDLPELVEIRARLATAAGSIPSAAR